MWTQFGLSWHQLLNVVLSTVGMYFVSLLLVRFVGSRLVRPMTPAGVAAVLGFGAVAGRAMLSNYVSLEGGVVALVTLVLMQLVVTMLTRRFPTHVGRSPVVLMRDGQPCGSNLGRVGLTEADLAGRLRLAGVTRYDEVGYAICEPNGEISILRAGEIDPRLLSGVRPA